MIESPKEKIRQILIRAAAAFAPLPPFEIERPKAKAHGELSTNLAMVLAKSAKKNPAEIAKTLAENLKKPENDPEGLLESVTVASGFLNLSLKRQAWLDSLRSLVAQGRKFGTSDAHPGRKAVVEFVSANPTGPLHIGNARGAPVGDAIASLLQATGWSVTREYYMNDVGGQIDKLGRSILYSLSNRPAPVTWNVIVSALKGIFEQSSEKIEYQGSYVDEIASKLLTVGGQVQKDVDEAIQYAGNFGIRYLTDEIKKDCDDIGIHFDSWIHEKAILATETEPVLKQLKEKGVTFEKEGALWYAMGGVGGREDGGEQIDRECVLVRSDGRPTYFANDIAYHVGKYKRGFDRLINIWGSNHHGHVPRVKAAVKSLGYDPEKIETVLYQYVRVKRGNEAVKMSKRAGNFVTAREVLDEVGKDAFRFFLLMRAPESHLDFDLSLAKEKSAENPVYYLQYAHARLCSIERKASEAGITLKPETLNLQLLTLPEELEMIRLIHEYPEEVVRAAERLEPHRIAFYLLELAKAFQAYYTKAKEDSRYRVLSGQVDTSRAKLYLCGALKLTFSQGLTLLGVSAPEVMTQEE